MFLVVTTGSAGATGIQEIEVEDAAQHPPVYNMAPHSKEILSPIRQKCVKLITPGLGQPWGSVVKNLPANAGDMGSIPGPERSHMPQSN